MKRKRLVGVVVPLVLIACGAHPADKALRDRFFREEASFNKLVQMAHEDSSMIRIAPEFMYPSDNAVAF